MLRRLALASLALLILACGTPQHPSLAFAIDDAAAQKKPLVVEFYATWCGPCKRFERDVLPDARVQAALAGVSFVRYDIDSPAGREAYDACHGSAVPIFVGIDRDGTVRLYKEGAEGSPDEFLAFLAQAKAVLAAPK
jgi:thiol:disulfide interchange protein DsbD